MYTSEYFADALIEFSSNSFVMIEALIIPVEGWSKGIFESVFVIVQSENVG